MVPRYEYPGRIVHAIGLWMSSWCVVLLLILRFG
jgi:hypothetical protein